MTKPAVQEIITKKKPTIGVYSVFDTLTGAYSLVNVVTDQIGALIRAGYPVQLWMFEDCNPKRDPRLKELMTEYPELQIVKKLPRLILKDYQDPTEKIDMEHFNTQVEQVERALVEDLLPNVDVVLTHDITFQTWFLPHNVAMRRASEIHQNVRFLHWMHSAPSEYRKDAIYPHTARYTGMERSTFIYLNDTDLARAASMRGLTEQEMRVVPNSRDICDYLQMAPITKEFVRKNRLLDADVLIVYPTRMCDAKQPEKLIKFASGFNRFKLSAKVVIINSYSDSPEAIEQMQKCKKLADKCGFGKSNLIFTSEFKSDVEFYKPWIVFCDPVSVSAIQALADVFVLPSVSEGCSLVALEAAIRRNLLVLNDDFDPIKDMFEHAAMYAHFSSTLKVTVHKKQGAKKPSEEAELEYYAGYAGKVVNELRSSKAMVAFNLAKRKYNADYIFSRYIEPLMY